MTLLGECPRPRRLATASLCLLALPALALADDGPKPQAVPPDHAVAMARGLDLFRGGVRETLTVACLDCHGGKSIKGEFDLSTREALLREGAEGPNVVPGKAAESRLYRMVAHLDQPKMPKGKPKLPDDQIRRLADWIDAGAPYDRPLVDKAQLAARDRSAVTGADRDFWSFRPLAKGGAPRVADEAWCRTPVDRFVLAKLEAKGLRPNPPASRRALIRRASFDLTGLPPTPEEVDAFEADARPDAYERLIDRLLASPAYGERWARHWLDLARYAESHGYEQDYDRPHAYHYRDFLVRVFNDDMPYDRFVRLQLAGDELEPANPQALMATGFLGAGTHATQITANQVEKERYDELDDMAATTGTALLGLTIGCARCHDHKFDPIPTRDYYRVAATFTTTVRSEIDLDLDPEATRRAKAAHDRDHARLVAARSAFERDALPARFDAWLASKPRLPRPSGRLVGPIVGMVDGLLARQADRTSPPPYPPPQGGRGRRKPSPLEGEGRVGGESALLAGWHRATDPDWLALDRAVRDHDRAAPAPKTTKVMVTSEGWPAVRFHTQGADFFDKTYLLKRGDLAQKQGEVDAGFLTVLDRASEGEARWKATPPPGWRTSYRRLGLANWIVDDSAGAGQLLARVIVNRAWQAHFGRGIVATPSDFGAQGDRPTHPELLDRLASDLIRGGWRLKPIHKLMMTSAAYLQTTDDDPARAKVDPDNILLWRRSHRRLEAEAIRDAMLACSGLLDRTLYGPGTLDEGMRRRSLYFGIKRSHLIPTLILFDAPDSLVGIGKRPSTTVAPQALALMNNEHVRASAKGLAGRVLPAAKESPAEAVRRAYRLALGRTPEPDELVACLDFLLAQSERYRADGRADALALALADACQSLFCLNEFVYVD